MLTINTNLSSLIVQTNLTNSTLGLNQAIERMTTGFKINGAKDNAAGYSISTNMSTKISAYLVAEDNASMGLDILDTASNSIALIDNGLARLRALATQAANGTYGETSLDAINIEANAIIDEIEREFNLAEYNGVKLFVPEDKEDTPSANLVNDIQTRDTSQMTALADVNDTTIISSGTYSISTASELAKLSDMTNAGYIQGGEFVLAADIDLKAYSSGEGWSPIGFLNYNTGMAAYFNGTFDGNGYVISNLYINRPTEMYQGLFGVSQSGTFKNVALENVNITGGSGSGALLGTADCSSNSTVNITNTYSNGVIDGSDAAGGLVGAVFEGSINITDSYTNGSISGNNSVGGFIGEMRDASTIISGSYILTQSTGVNGLFIGSDDNNSSNFTITDSYVSSYYDNKNIDYVAGYGQQTSSSGATGGVSSYNDGIPPSASGSAGIVISGDNIVTFQVGIHSDSASQITADLSFALGNLNTLRNIGHSNGNYLAEIDKMLAAVSTKQTELGAASNRLESVLEEIAIQYENLVSSRSTIRDADIAEESSDYIKMQILQQASATLLATANQTPALALQLL